MLDTGLADRIRAKGVEVVEVAGWKTRSRPYAYNPRGAVNHHTAGSANGRVPSLATVIYGRSDLPGPLAQVLQSRESSGLDKAYVIAAGAANHAGPGGWNGLTGNGSVGGLEVEHIGTTSVRRERLETAARIIAALLEAPGATRNAGYACQHFEWAPRRKIDFFNLAPHFDTHSFRQRVRYWIGRTVRPPEPKPELPKPEPEPNPEEDEQVKLFRVRRTNARPEHPTHFTDLATTIFDVKNEGPYDKLWQDLTRLGGGNPNGLTFDQDVIEDMYANFPEAGVRRNDEL